MFVIKSDYICIIYLAVFNVIILGRYDKSHIIINNANLTIIFHYIMICRDIVCDNFVLTYITVV